MHTKLNKEPCDITRSKQAWSLQVVLVVGQHASGEGSFLAAWVHTASGGAAEGSFWFSTSSSDQTWNGYWRLQQYSRAATDWKVHMSWHEVSLFRCLQPPKAKNVFALRWAKSRSLSASSEKIFTIKEMTEELPDDHIYLMFCSVEGRQTRRFSTDNGWDTSCSLTFMLEKESLFSLIMVEGC